MNMQKYSDAINSAVHELMQHDERVICYGLGVNDPARIFQTTQNLLENFGEERVFDMPTAENGMLGVGIGAAIGGLRPIMVHQRLDFFLLCMDQLVNTAAKWFYMFGGHRSVPITIRLVVGRGWGQGPTHSQSLQALFAHIPGLKVVMPSNPADAKGMLITSVLDDNPVLFIEHRWLHNQLGEVPSEEMVEVSIGRSKVVREGDDITIIALSYQVVESIKAADFLRENYGISCQVVDMVSVNPIPFDLLVSSAKKTGHLICVDTGVEIGSVMSEVISHITINHFDCLKSAPVKIARPFIPEGTSYSLATSSYSGAYEIACAVRDKLKLDCDLGVLKISGMKDVPGKWFSGPF